MKYKKIVTTFLLIVIGILVVGCGANTNSEKVKDSGEKEEVVIATSVAVTQILDTLGVKVSGVPTTSYELPESCRDAVAVGNPMNPDLELIKSLNPTVVVSVNTLGSEYEALFTDNNIPSEFVSLSSLQGLKETVKTLGERFNKEEKANDILKELESKEEEVSKNREGKKTKILVVFAAPGSTMLATSRSYIGSLVELVGGENIIPESNLPYVTYNKEDITKLNPDKVLVMAHANPEETIEAIKKEFSTDPAWTRVDAIKKGKIEYLDSNYFGMSANLKVIEGLDILNNIVHGKEE